MHAKFSKKNGKFGTVVPLRAERVEVYRSSRNNQYLLKRIFVLQLICHENKLHNFLNNIIKLKDFELWKNSNNKMDINNYLTAIIDHYKIPSDFLILFSDLIFPEFIVLEEMIFFKNHFKEDYFNRLKKEKNSCDEIEYWMNLILISSYFPDSNEFIDHALFFAEKLKKSIDLKLKNDFPNKIFSVDFTHDQSNDDILFTFYQK